MTRMDRLRAWLKGSTSAPPAPTADDRPVQTGMAISTSAQWEAMRTGKPAPEPHDLFERPVPPAGVLPAGMAMDSLPAVNGLASWGLASVFHEGLAFPGYAYLAELAQRPEYRHMAEIWAEHATRKWIKLTGPDEDRLGVIEAEFERLNVRALFQAADEVDGKFGRAHIYMDFGDGERSQRLMVDARKVTPARPLKSLKVVEPMWIYPGIYDSINPLEPDHYRPRYWYVQGQTVADSRLLTFVRHPVPDMLKPSYAFGGQSYTQLAKPYVDNWLRTRQSVSDVTSAFSQMVLATDMGSALTGGTGASLYQRVDMFNRTRDNRGTMVINKDSEELTNVTTPLSGLDALQSQAQEQLSSVARIPLSIYLQVTPTGLNASSEGEIRSFYADVTAHQEKDYRPPLQTLLEIVQLGIDGRIDPDVKFVFEPLWEMSALDSATVRKTEADTDAVYTTMGAISNDEVREKLRNEDGGPYQGVNLEGDAPEPELDEPTDDPADGTAQDGWNEADHPRAPDGQFGTGGSLVKAFAASPVVWTSKASGIEYVANPIPQVSQAERASVHKQGDAVEDAMVDENQEFFNTKEVDPAQLKSLQSQVARDQVVSVHSKGSHNSDDNGELPLVIDGPDGLILVDGNHRSVAALLAGGKIKAQVFDYDAWEKAEEAKKPVKKSSKDDDDALLAELMA